MPKQRLTQVDRPSEKQYKTQLKKWNLDTKYIKASEYMFMLRTMREREALDPPKETRFILRGRVVDPKDIARFEKRAQKKGANPEGDPVDNQGKFCCGLQVFCRGFGSLTRKHACRADRRLDIRHTAP